MSENAVTAAEVRDIVVGAIEALVLPRFDEQEARFDAQDKRFDSQDRRLEDIERRLTKIEEGLHDMRGDIRLLKSSLGRLEAIEADIKELYAMVAANQKQHDKTRRFAKQPFERKVLQVYEDFQLLAKEAGITLPR